MIYGPDSPEYRIADKTSELMGGGLRDEVIDYIDTARHSGLCMHGIKNAVRNLPNIKRNGVENKTPEGGNVSFWSTGFQIFHTSKVDLSFFGYDTPFFHYSIGRENGGVIRALATTTLNALQDAGLHYEPTSGNLDRQITVAETVPVHLIELYTGIYPSHPESSRDIFLKLYEASMSK